MKPWCRCIMGSRRSKKLSPSERVIVQELGKTVRIMRSLRTSIDGFAGSDDIDINGDKPLRGYTREQVECLSEDLHFVKEIVDNRERIAKIKT